MKVIESKKNRIYKLLQFAREYNNKEYAYQALVVYGELKAYNFSNLLTGAESQDYSFFYELIVSVIASL